MKPKPGRPLTPPPTAEQTAEEYERAQDNERAGRAIDKPGCRATIFEHLRAIEAAVIEAEEAIGSRRELIACKALRRIESYAGLARFLLGDELDASIEP